MTIIIPKNATKEEIKKAIAEFEKKRNTKRNKNGKPNAAKLFGSNPAEADGHKFQKKVRSEWD